MLFNSKKEAKEYFLSINLFKFKFILVNKIYKMYFKEIKKLEEIYPLTIVNRRFGGFAILKCDSICVAVSVLQEDEEVHYDTESYMKKYWGHLQYGIGNTIQEAFINYETKYNV